MPSLDSILDGLADALELERELGTRVVEIDRALLRGEDKRQEIRDTRAGEDKRQETRDTRAAEDKRQEIRDTRAAGDARQETREAPGGERQIVFLHDRALSPEGVTMMAKAIEAMHLTAESAPILFTGPIPDARVTVVLGSRALRRWFPGVAGSPGQWISPGGRANVLVTYSPDYILLYGSGRESLQKLKRELWNSLKAALQRLGLR